MEYNPSVNMILPDSIGLMENDFDEDDLAREQTHQNEIVELIMAAFEGHDEPSDDDDGSLNTTDSSSDEQQVNNNSNEQNEFQREPNFFPSTAENDHQEVDNPFNPKPHLVHYQNASRPPSDIIDPMQAQYLYQTSTSNLNETQNQLNKLRILCSVKDRKASQLQSLCDELREKYQSDTRVLQHQLELSERSKHDWEQSYQLRNTQYEELIENNNQLHRTIKDSDLKIQQLESIQIQFEKKCSDSESLIESLHRKMNELHQYESMARTQHDYESILSTTREKHDQEIIAFNEKIQNIQMNLQEKNIEVDEVRVQLEIANKNTEKSIFERMESINHLNEQLHDSQRKYADLLNTNSLESLHQVEIHQQLLQMTNEKEKFQTKCQEFESEIRTLREQLTKAEENRSFFDEKNDRDSLDESIHNENLLLKERINEYISKERQLREINEELQRINSYSSKHSDSSSSSSSSSSSNETVITASVHMEQIRKLIALNEKLKKDFADLEEQHRYEKQELYIVIEQLRDDVNELDKTKKLYIDVCQEKNSMEDALRSKIDELHRTFDDENQLRKKTYHEDLEQFHQEADRQKMKHEKQLTELNNELDRLRANDDTESRLIYTEKEFDQLKHDYHNLNQKHTDLLKTCAQLESDNEHLLNSLEQLKQLTSQQEQELLTVHQKSDQKQINLEGDIESLELRIENYENVVRHYEEYRGKLEDNLQKLTQQRDTNKVELRVMKETLVNKENDYNQLKIRFDQCERHLQTHQEQFRQYENTISELEQQYKRNAVAQETERIRSLEADKCRLERCLQEANRALDLADSHLQKEIKKIKASLEQEYNRRYERDHKQHPSTINLELNQHQSKLIDTHQKQMQNFEESYKNVSNEFQREQVRSQARYDQLRQQLNDALQTIEQLKSNLNQMKLKHSEELAKIQQEYNNESRSRQNLLTLLEQSDDKLNQERTIRTRQENDHQQTVNALQRKISEIVKQYTKTIDELKHELQNERLTNENNLTARPISVPDFTSTNSLPRSDYLTTVEKLRELFTNEMLALLQLTCKMIFDVHHRVTVAPWMDKLEISMKKQIQNELIRSRNSMIKEIRREIFEKMTYALRSQGVPDKTIDMHIFELDRLLSQMIQDCLNSLRTVSPSASNSSLHIPPQTSTAAPPRKSVDYLYITSSSNKKPAPLAPHPPPALDHTHRQKSISNSFLTKPNPTASHTHKFQRANQNQRNIRIKMHRSEDDIVHAVRMNPKEVTNLDEDDDVSSTVCEHHIKHEPTKVQLLTSSLPARAQAKHPPRIIDSKKQDKDDEDELTWPQQPIPIVPATQSNGIKKFVRNGLKLFIAQPPSHKRSGK